MIVSYFHVYCIGTIYNHTCLTGGIGQPLSLLAKQSNLVKELSLYDVAPVTPVCISFASCIVNARH